VDAYDAAEALHAVLASAVYREPRYNVRSVVT
jgi:hypothetical protein